MMTLTPWSHAPTEDPKRPTKQPSNRRKTTKEEKTLFKGAYMSFTTNKSCIIHGLTAKKFMYKYKICDCSICNSRAGGKIPKKGQNCLRKAGEVCY